MDKPKTSTPERDALRAAAFAVDPARDARVVEFNGVKFEVRAPSLGLQERVEKLEGMAKRTVELLLECVYVPSTGERAFERADRDVLLGLPMSPNGMLATFGKAFAELMSVSAEEVEKNSESAPTAS